MTRFLGAAVAVLLAAGAAAAQPPRDTRRPAAGVLSISGVVLAADGETPLRRAVVTLAATELAKKLSTRTGADGRYEFAGLPASGSFTVTASKAQYVTLEYGQRRPFEPGRAVALSGRSLTNVDFRLPRAAVITGTVLDTSGEPVEQMWVVALRRAFVDGRRRMTVVRLGVTNDTGQYRLAGLAPGDYFVVARERGATPGEFSRERVGYPVTYFPSIANVQEAQPVRLAIGQQTSGTDIVVAPARTATIGGQVIRVDGSPVPRARVMLLDHAESGPGGGITGGGSGNEQGVFKIAGVRAGQYYLMAEPSPGPGGSRERGMVPLDVTGADMTGLTVVVGAGGTLSARVVSSSGKPLPIQPAQVELTARLLGDPFLFMGTVRPAVKPGWTVDWVGVTGPRVIRPARLPRGWWMKAVLRGEADVTDERVEVTHGQAVKDLVVVLDDNPTELTGTVRDRAGAPVADYTVVLFSPDSTRWTPESRFVHAARPDHTGAFRLSGLPPGDYLIAAVEYVEQGQWLDTSYLESLRPRAQKITLEAGKPVVLTLAGGT